MSGQADAGTGQVKDRILRVSAGVFADFGYAGAPIRQIANLAEISIPSIYHHYGDKRGLYSAVCSTSLKHNSEQYREILRGTGQPEARLIRFVRALCANLFDDPIHSKLLQRMFIDSQASGLDQISTNEFDETFGLLVKVVAEVTDHRNPRFLAFSLYALALGLMQMREVYDAVNDTSMVDDGIDQVATEVLNSLIPSINWSKVVD